MWSTGVSAVVFVARRNGAVLPYRSYLKPTKVIELPQSHNIIYSCSFHLPAFRAFGARQNFIKKKRANLQSALSLILGVFLRLLLMP